MTTPLDLYCFIGALAVLLLSLLEIARVRRAMRAWRHAAQHTREEWGKLRTVNRYLLRENHWMRQERAQRLQEKAGMTA